MSCIPKPQGASWLGDLQAIDGGAQAGGEAPAGQPGDSPFQAFEIQTPPRGSGYNPRNPGPLEAGVGAGRQPSG